MNSLQLVQAIRPGGASRTERHYLDFSVSGRSLKELLSRRGSDLITLLGWGRNSEYTAHILRVFKLQEKPELASGRALIYVCPACGDVDCGAITANIVDYGDRIVWKDFGYETDYGGISEIYADVEPIEFERQSYFAAFPKF